MTSADACALPRSAPPDPASLRGEPLPSRSPMMAAVALLCGPTVDIGGALVVSVVIVVLRICFQRATDGPPGATHAAMLDSGGLFSGWSLLGMLVGSGLSVLGG
jgi:hypothetical protein